MRPATTRRVGQGLLSLFAASLLVWSLLAFAPGDPARRVLAANNVSQPNADQVREKRHELGLSGNPAARYLRWLGGAVRGDLGVSWVTGGPVRHELGARLPATLVLTSAAVGLSLTMALALACMAASAPGRWPDAAARLVSLLALVTPTFLVGLALLHVVVLRLGYFRVVSDGSWGTVFLPALTLSLGAGAVWSRVLRAGLVDARGAGHADVCRARGAGPLRLLIVHDLPNALVPFLTVVGTGFAALLGGAAIVETVFTWPGVGRYAVQGITSRDLPVVQGYTLLAIAAFVVVSMAVDLVALAIDPRIATEGARSRGGWRLRGRLPAEGEA